MQKLLMVGIDAAEPRLIRALIDRGELPNLRSMLPMREVESPADIGSGAVWPTFITGKPPLEHGIHSEWQWNPVTMGLRRARTHELEAFWLPLADAGVRVGLVDIPYAPFDGDLEGFEIAEWGAHDRLAGRTQLSMNVSVPVHPFSTDDDFEAGAGAIAAKCLSGARLRAETVAQLLRERPVDLAIVVFTEIHHASHVLWGEAERELQDGFDSDRPSSITAVLREIDASLPAMLEASGEGTRVVVFSLHGMRPGRGIPLLLERALVERAYARPADWSSLSWRDRAATVFGAMKRRTPDALKRLYYRTAPAGTTHRLAGSTMLPPYDWSRTRAFSVPSDQHGWVRINLRGREALGIVPQVEYAGVRDAVAGMLRELKNADGERLVERVIVTAPDAESARGSLLPDLIVHWTEAAEAFISPKARKLQTGQHDLRGFAMARGLELPDAVRAETFAAVAGELSKRSEGAA